MDQRQPTEAELRRGRRRKSDDEWRELFREQDESGLTHAEFCRQRSMSIYSYRWHKRRLTSGDKEPAPSTASGPEARSSLVPVRIAAQPRPVPLPGPLEVILGNGRTVRVTGGFDARMLLEVVRALEGAC